MNFNSFAFDEAEFQAVGRIGMAPAEQILLYLSGGVGYSYGLEASVGIGAEFMVTDNMSLRADLSEYIWSSSSYEPRFTISALWHM
jgi:opacity protein-like surface antigen